jgi:hypothetical protein
MRRKGQLTAAAPKNLQEEAARAKAGAAERFDK